MNLTTGSAAVLPTESHYRGSPLQPCGYSTCLYSGRSGVQSPARSLVYSRPLSITGRQKGFAFVLYSLFIAPDPTQLISGQFLASRLVLNIFSENVKMMNRNAQVDCIDAYK